MNTRNQGLQTSLERFLDSQLHRIQHRGPILDHYTKEVVIICPLYCCFSNLDPQCILQCGTWTFWSL